jgi:hypothetical protein
MSVNKHRPHILVLPEDDANRQIALGFTRNLDTRSIQIMPIADGWKKAIDQLINDYASRMREFPERRIVLLIDFDCVQDRLTYAQSLIPEDLIDRVFVIGVLSNPEDLKKTLKQNFESIGESLAKDCSKNTDKAWGHDLLKHNQTELARMVRSVKPFLFGIGED